MTPQRFDRIMVHTGAGQHLKLRPLTDSEWRCFIGGVLPIAGMAPIRGCLLVGERKATPEDVAHQAGTKRAAGSSALKKLRELGIVYHDDELDCDRVHDFEDWNPPPRHDKTAAERAKRYRERRAARLARLTGAVTDRDVTRDVTPPNALEVEGERKNPPNPPRGQGVKFAGKVVPAQRLDLAQGALTVFNATAGTNYGAWTTAGKPSENLKRIIGALTAHPDVDRDTAAAAIVLELGRPDPYWDVPHLGVVFGPKVFEQILEAVRRDGVKVADGTSFVDRLNSRRAAA